MWLSIYGPCWLWTTTMCILKPCFIIVCLIIQFTVAMISLSHSRKQVTKYETLRLVCLKNSVAGSAAHCTSDTNLKVKSEIQLIKEQSLDYIENAAPLQCLLTYSLFNPRCTMFWRIGSCKIKEGKVFFCCLFLSAWSALITLEDRLLLSSIPRSLQSKIRLWHPCSY